MKSRSPADDGAREETRGNGRGSLMCVCVTRSELQAKVHSLSCDDLDRVFDDCGLQYEFDREIKFLMIAEIERDVGLY